MVFKVHKTKDFTIMSNYHFQDKGLSLKAKGLLSMMLSLPEDWDYSIKGLATLSSDGETSVRTGLQELEEHGYLIRSKVRINGIITDWQYDIYETPRVENQHVENHRQLNTKELSTKEINNNTISNEIVGEAPDNSHLSETRSTRRIPLVEKKEKKKSRYEKCLDIIDELVEDTELKEKLKVYLQMRLSMKDRQLYANQWKSLVEKLLDMSDNNEERIKIVKQSIETGWASFYPLKKNYTKSDKYGKAGVFNEYDTVKTVRDREEDITNERF